MVRSEKWEQNNETKILKIEEQQSTHPHMNRNSNIIFKKNQKGIKRL